MPAETGALLQHLEEKASKEGALPRLLEFYRTLLRVQDGFEQKIASRLEPGLSREAISRRIDRSSRLVAFDELALDWCLLRETFTRVRDIFADYADLFAVAPGTILELDAGSIVTEPVVEEWYEKQRVPAGVPASDAGENIVSAILHAALKPFLVGHARALAGSFDQERWRRSYCPVCGGVPDISFLGRELGTRYLVCSRCDTEWVFQRLRCPYCGNQDQNALGYHTTEDGVYRLYTCQNCKSYLKTIDLRNAEGEVFPALERLLTLDLDRQGKEMGFSAGRAGTEQVEHNQ